VKLSTRARYGARALVELAPAYPDSPVSTRDLAERQHLSAKYLEQIMRSLKAAGLVTAVRGMHGGFVLSCPPENITLQDIFEALEGSIAPVECADHPDSCPMQEVCPTRDTWVEMMQSMERVLEGTTIKDLAARKRAKCRASSPTYQI